MKTGCNSEKVEQIRDSVRTAYSKIATSGDACCLAASGLFTENEMMTFW